jgi:hypothetical protein
LYAVLRKPAFAGRLEPVIRRASLSLIGGWNLDEAFRRALELTSKLIEIIAPTARDVREKIPSSPPP